MVHSTVVGIFIIRTARKHGSKRVPADFLSSMFYCQRLEMPGFFTPTPIAPTKRDIPCPYPATSLKNIMLVQTMQP
jgi:hypothetical protein